MNPWQLTKELVYRLSPAQLVWPEGAGAAVLGAVMATPVSAEFWNANNSTPFAVVRPDGDRANSEHPELLDEVSWAINLYSALSRDLRLGEPAVSGGTRTSGIGSSVGRGVLEVEARVRAAIHAARLGVRFRVSSGSGIDPRDAPGPGVVAQSSFRVTASRVPVEPFYHPPILPVASGGFGSASLAWTSPPTRFDRFGIMVRRLAGFNLPTTTTGDQIVAPSSGAGVTSYLDSPAAGTYSYGIWAAYDEAGAGAADRFSARVGVVAVTVT